MEDRVLARLLYTLLLYLLAPLMLVRLMLRGLRNRDYLRRWRDRFGYVPRLTGARSIWLHAVSVGEVNALARLVEGLLARHPEVPLILTTGTPTGLARVRQLFGQRVHHTYLPYDLPGVVRRFFARTRPRLGVIAETEIWPNLYTAAGRRRVPLMIVNARLSERSMRGFAILPGVRLISAALEAVVQILAQSEADAERYRRLGARSERVRVVGNLKFDMAVADSVRGAGARVRVALGSARPVWIAASTHEAEEQAVLHAHAAVLRALPEALLLIAPRHPERFRAVAQAARAADFSVSTRSSDDIPASRSQCFVLDSLGELMTYYAAADLAFVGGSLAPIGGHNALEPAALAVPVLVGPHTFNFQDITEALLASGAAWRIAQAAALGDAVLALLQDAPARARMGAAALGVIERGRGALAEIETAIERELAASARAAPVTAAAR